MPLDSVARWRIFSLSLISDEAEVLPPEPVVGGGTGAGVGAGAGVVGTGVDATGLLDELVLGALVVLGMAVLGVVPAAWYVGVDEVEVVELVGAGAFCVAWVAWLAVGLITTLGEIGILLTSWSSCC